MPDDLIMLLLPTRGRIWSAMAAIASIMRTATDKKNILIHVLMDDDDKYTFPMDFPVTSPIGVWRQPRKGFCDWINTAVDFGLNNLPAKPAWFGWVGDDVRYETDGWDVMVRERRELIVFGNDGYENKPTHPFVRRIIPETLGFLIPPGLHHYCCDTFIGDLGVQIGSIFHDERILTEHHHPDAHKGTIDRTYQDALRHYDADVKTYHSKIRPTIPDLAEKVRVAKTRPPDEQNQQHPQTDRTENHCS